MITNARTVDRRMLTRKCVCCGFDGAAINQPAPPLPSQPHRCPRCGCDLRQRPARSYAEMEGLLGTPSITQPREIRIAEAEQAGRHDRLVHRWLAFLFIAMAGMLAIAYLAAAVMAV